MEKIKNKPMISNLYKTIQNKPCIFQKQRNENLKIIYNTTLKENTITFLFK